MLIAEHTGGRFTRDCSPRGTQRYLTTQALNGHSRRVLTPLHPLCMSSGGIEKPRVLTRLLQKLTLCWLQPRHYAYMKIM